MARSLENMLKRERRFDHRELLWNPFDDMLQLSLCTSDFASGSRYLLYLTIMRRIGYTEGPSTSGCIPDDAAGRPEELRLTRYSTHLQLKLCRAPKPSYSAGRGRPGPHKNLKLY